MKSFASLAIMVVLAALFTSTCKANDVINAAPISASEKYYVGADSMSLLHKLSSGLTNKNFNATEDRGSRQTPSVVIDRLRRAWINDEWLQQRLWNLSRSISLCAYLRCLNSFLDCPSPNSLTSERKRSTSRATGQLDWLLWSSVWLLQPAPL